MRKTRKLSKGLFFVMLTLITLSVSGCGALTIPDPTDIIKKPLGTESIKIGMTKSRVESIWGKPDQITTVENKEKWSV